jgi:hypothetical protein
MNLNGDRPMTHGWWTLVMPDDSQHIVPAGDLLDHEDEDCPCLPSVQPITNDEGDFLVFQTVHHAWDGRP